MRNLCLILSQMGLLLATYLVICFIPVAFIIAGNVYLDPSACWPDVAETWLGSHGVPYPGLSMVTAYSLAVFYPAIRFAVWVAFDKADPFFNALMRDEDLTGG